MSINEVFRDRLEHEINGLSNEQLVEFACICAIRTVPFMGIDSSRTWRAEIKKHIYNIFNAIDVSMAYKNSIYNKGKYNKIRSNILNSEFKASARMFNFLTRRNETFFTNNIATKNALYTAFSSNRSAATNSAFVAAYSCSLAGGDIAGKNYDIFVIEMISFALKASASFSDFINILIDDLHKIKNNQPLDKVNPKEFYGKVWIYFINLLNKEKCGYWGRVYEKIFKSGFDINLEELERRLNVPESIRDEGAAAVARYLEELEKEGGQLLNEARIIILGEKGAGKTCLARRLLNTDSPMTTIEESTPGVDTSIWQPENEKLKIRVWDFAGHTVTHAVHRFFLSERCLYIMVYDGRTEERNRIEYWLDHIKNYGGDSKAIILVNKRDNHSNNIPIYDLKDRYSIDNLFEFSIQDDKNDLEEFRRYIINYIKNNPSWNKQEIPNSYYKVKEELEKLFVKGDHECCTEKIEKRRYEEIAEKYGIDDKDQLLENLHSLGISLWYKDIDGIETLVLNPEWISQGVYKVINWLSNQKRYSISRDEDLKEVFKEDIDRYPVGEHDFIYKLLLKYELAYEGKKEGTLIVPQLLLEDRPEVLPEFSIGESLMLRYKAEQPLPPDTISRFIVRHNQEIKREKNKDIVWRKGVVLKDGGNTIALVREQDRIINVYVKGDNKTEYICKLRDTLNEIFNSYKSKKPELEYRIERYGLIPDERSELWLTEGKMVGHINQNEPYFDEQTGRKLYLNQSAKSYGINNCTFNGTVIIESSDFNINNFNFYNCNIGLQGSLNELAQLFKERGKQEEAEELSNAATILEHVEQCKTPEELKKKGTLNRIRRVIDELGDENSSLHSAVKKVKNGISVVQDIAGYYNDIAQWVGLPQVPKPFLKKE